MKSRNLRHFRVLLSVADLQSPTLAAVACNVSQPAITQCLGKLDRDAGGPLFHRSRGGFFLSDRGAVIATRLSGAMERLDNALDAVSPRLRVTATFPQLQAIVAVDEAQNIALAARQMGHAQPTVQRAIRQLEQAASRPLFERTRHGTVATRACRDLAQAARLAFSEFDQVEADLAEFDGREVGTIVVGTLPLARSALLPEALAQFRRIRARQRVSVLDGPYDDMLRGVRRGRIDFMIGALRPDLPVEDVHQEPLFDDSLCFVVRPGHPLANAGSHTRAALLDQQWAVPREGTPSRAQFNAFFEQDGGSTPDSIIDCGSILLMRELLTRSDMVGCISNQQAKAEIASGLLARLAVEQAWETRPIGLTYRAGWVPTKAQDLLLGYVRDAARKMDQFA